jgi:hypothetical protein
MAPCAAPFVQQMRRELLTRVPRTKDVPSDVVVRVHDVVIALRRSSDLPPLW